jgi:hypothetical protein
LGPPAPTVAAPAPINGPAVPAPVDLSAGLAEVIRLAESGVGDEVVLAYVRNSQAFFSITADHVVYLKDLGLSSEIISAILTHDTELRAKGPIQYTVPTNPPAVAAPAPAPPPEPMVEQPAPVYVTEPPPAEVNYFYNDLAPYGSWVVLDGYGWCWQPRTVVINRGWRPYCDGGRWVYSDCGWYWASDYSWGWAPFHYGRWTMHNTCGWVWMPDRVWGPAWVTWRVGGSYCGWAPLPPRTYYDGHHGWRHNGVHVGINVDFGLHADHFTFVGMSGFTDRNLRHHRMGSTEVKRVFNQTTVINNYGNNNTTFVNQGVPVDRVETATHRPIRRAVVRDVPADARARANWQTPSRDRNSSDPVVYRTQLSTPSTPTRAVAQRVDERHPVVQHPTLTSSRWQQRPRGSADSTLTQTPNTTPTTVTSPNVAARSAGNSSWQTPQRSVGTPSQRSGLENRSTPRGNAATPAAPATPAVTTQGSAQSATPATPASPANRSSWQTPSRNDRTATQPNRPEQQIYRPSVSPSATRDEKPASSSLPQQSRWDVPSRRQAAPNVVQTAPPQGNPHVYYPKASASSQSSTPRSSGGGGWSTPSSSARAVPPTSQRPSQAPASSSARAVPQTSQRPSQAPAATVRPAPQSNNSSSRSGGQWQTPRSDSSSRGSSKSNSSQNRDN